MNTRSALSRAGTRTIGAAAVAALAVTVVAVGHQPAGIGGTAVAAQSPFPYIHMTVETSAEADVDDGDLWVTVDDGAARAELSRSRAVPADGELSEDAAYSDPAGCDRDHGHQGVCWRSWQVVGHQVRVSTTYLGLTCDIIGDTEGAATQVLCR